MNEVLLYLDKFLINLYLFPTGNPITDFLLGTFLLSALCVVIGNVSIKLAFKINRRFISKRDEEFLEFSRKAESAAKRGEKKIWKRLNQSANNLFGKKMFFQFILGAASLWPIFFALAFMEYRFGHLRFPLPYIENGSIGYLLIFLLEYLVARIIIKNGSRKIKDLISGKQEKMPG
jgi:uncharacterized membrane protein (DUF106 family)